MKTWAVVLLVILAILIVAVVVLYFLGRKMQKKQEERRRLKAEDPEAYRKLKEKEDQEMREYTDSVPFWD